MANAKERGRSRLDASLVAPALSQESGVLEIVRQQLSKSPLLGKQHQAWTKIDRAAEKRAQEVSTFLDGLRSARQELLDNEETPFSWKIKEETDLMRVMYRPGPEGTPFHTYCVEGIVNGPMINAVCVAWEAPSFGLWCPQFNVPTFKITESRWVKRIRVGEDLAHIRVKVPWPMASREVLMTEFELEHFEDDIVIILLGTAPSDPDEVEQEVYDITGDELPPINPNAVRIEIAGGFIIQKMTDEQSFFRTVVNMDIKLDYVPPWVINFITRQLIGSGYKLYQKAVLAASKPVGSGKAFQQLIATEALYCRIRAGLNKIPDREPLAIKFSKEAQETNAVTESEIVSNRMETLPNSVKEPFVTDQVLSKRPSDSENFRTLNSRQERPVIQIDAEVERALEVLDKMIEIARNWKSQSALHSPTRTMSALAEDCNSVDNLPNGHAGAASSSDYGAAKTSNEEQSSSENGALKLSNSSKVGACFGSGRKQLEVRPKQHEWPKLALLKRILFIKPSRKELLR